MCEWLSWVPADSCCKRLFCLIRARAPEFSFPFPACLEPTIVITHSCLSGISVCGELCCFSDLLHKGLCHWNKVWFCLGSLHLKGQPWTWWLQNQLGMLSVLSACSSELATLCLPYASCCEPLDHSQQYWYVVLLGIKTFGFCMMMSDDDEHFALSKAQKEKPRNFS